MKYLVSFLLFLTVGSFAQKIKIKDKSFEATDRNWMEDWSDCGDVLFPEETPPDVHNDRLKFKLFGVTKKASDGVKFVGIVVRNNDTHEAIIQELRKPLQKGKCYKLSLDIAKSETYLSMLRSTDRKQNFTQPCVLRIWGNKDWCYYDQLLAKTKTVENYEWKEITFKLEPEENYQYIMIEAYWDEDKLENGSYCGHILIDNLSDLEEIDCDTKFKTNY